MSQRVIYITEFDMDRLLALIEGMRSNNTKPKADLDLLERELYRAKLVEPQDVPHDVITMNSKVCIKDMQSGEKTTYCVVFPSDANITKNKLSVLAPMGMALLGYRKGDIIEWKVPSGAKKIKVEEIVYQPEASGDFHL
ncbi:MAG TPA: nucleoside diphosphate kinase regulator [Smithellaceae bacterium]|jgi:regulator of nucleoside diphosphate kinase|nr:nucleoside diphosphate kinase regulator [Smithellaceae bacterium]HNT91888.1 nucleoside diphosphate kinase regulator [Smithellaceae bacterium]HNV65293.1 nucleoside diphosphate kinase regulator [Smithellaceae bacterium]HOD31627.1 nucleoside diphosphate kinase regulator [Smithellaceae bacterium]HOF77079.1 nucleoside diphosphate kinase regulator [Smithellaceae bacterium]